MAETTHLLLKLPSCGALLCEPLETEQDGNEVELVSALLPQVRGTRGLVSLLALLPTPLNPQAVLSHFHPLPSIHTHMGPGAASRTR